MKRIIPMLLSMCLLVTGSASAKSIDNAGNSGYVEISGGSYVDDSAVVKGYLEGDTEISYDDGLVISTVADPINESFFPAYQFEEISYDDQNCFVCETIMSPIGDSTYEVCTPDGEVLGVLYLGTTEKSAALGTLFNINWTVSSKHTGHTNRVVNASVGTTIREALIKAVKNPGNNQKVMVNVK